MRRFPNSPFGKMLQYEEYPRSPMGSGSRSSGAILGLQDFTTFTKADPDGNITVAENQLSITNMDSDVVALLQRDYGAGAFGNYVHRIKFSISAYTINVKNPVLGIWGLGNVVGTLSNALNDGIMFYAQASAGNNLLMYLLQYTPVVTDFQQVAFGVGVTRWVEFQRSGTTTTAKIYTDAFSTLEDTLTITSNTTQFSKIATAQSGEFAGGPWDAAVISGTINDLNLVS